VQDLDLGQGGFEFLDRSFLQTGTARECGRDNAGTLRVRRYTVAIAFSCSSRCGLWK
jgi:hypothetical protein